MQRFVGFFHLTRLSTANLHPRGYLDSKNPKRDGLRTVGARIIGRGLVGQKRGRSAAAIMD